MINPREAARDWIAETIAKQLEPELGFAVRIRRIADGIEATAYQCNIPMELAVELAVEWCDLQNGEVGTVPNGLVDSPISTLPRTPVSGEYGVHFTPILQTATITSDQASALRTTPTKSLKISVTNFYGNHRSLTAGGVRDQIRSNRFHEKNRVCQF